MLISFTDIKTSTFQIVENKFWAELVAKSKNLTENDSEHSELHPQSHDVETNVYHFGVLLLEIISGKLPYSDEPCLVNWVCIYWTSILTIISKERFYYNIIVILQLPKKLKGV